MDVVRLRQQMLNFLDVAALAEVAAVVDVDLAALPGGKGRKVQGLLQAAEQRGALPALLAACRARQPDVAWQ